MRLVTTLFESQLSVFSGKEDFSVTSPWFTSLHFLPSVADFSLPDSGPLASPCHLPAWAHGGPEHPFSGRGGGGDGGGHRHNRPLSLSSLFTNGTYSY